MSASAALHLIPLSIIRSKTGCLFDVTGERHRATGGALVEEQQQERTKMQQKIEPAAEAAEVEC